MNKQVNANFVCAELFVEELFNQGVRFVSISPGSRSTPLTTAFALNKKIKSFINFDERSSAFFALGIAKSTKQPVAIVTTSGTAVAELFPAVVEAFMSGIPLIVCTADRPEYLRNSGANQTINQENIFNNHTCWFKQMNLPATDRKSLFEFRKTAAEAFKFSAVKNKGPVHINFPFEKPLGPDNYNAVVSLKTLNSVRNEKITFGSRISAKPTKAINIIAKKINKTKNGWIVAGPMESNKLLASQILLLSEKTGYPIFADGTSNLRQLKSEKIISGYNLLLRSDFFSVKNIPEVIIQFGKTPVSSILEKIFANQKISIFTINESGSRFDSRKEPALVIKMNPIKFCLDISEKISRYKRSKHHTTKLFHLADRLTKKITGEYLKRKDVKFEPVILDLIIKNLPVNTKVVIGNSLPVRDLDNFITTNNEVEFYVNRGASGIDGITSTALGIKATLAKHPVVLLTGDLSFIHDLNALIIAEKYSIPLTVFLINNDGGAIFNSLPQIINKNIYRDFFITPHGLNIGKLVTAFGIKYSLVKNVKQLASLARNVRLNSELRVIEIKSDPVRSQKLRNQLYLKVEKIIDKNFG